MQELGNASHLGQTEAVPVALQALAGSHTADVVLKLEVGREGWSLPCGTLAVHSYEEGTAVSWVSGDVHVLEGEGGRRVDSPAMEMVVVERTLMSHARGRGVWHSRQGVSSGPPEGTQ